MRKSKILTRIALMIVTPLLMAPGPGGDPIGGNGVGINTGWKIIVPRAWPSTEGANGNTVQPTDVTLNVSGDAGSRNHAYTVRVTKNGSNLGHGSGTSSPGTNSTFSCTAALSQPIGSGRSLVTVHDAHGTQMDYQYFRVASANP